MAAATVSDVCANNRKQSTFSLWIHKNKFKSYLRPGGERLRLCFGGGERLLAGGDRDFLRSDRTAMRSRERLRRATFLSRERLRRVTFLSARGDRLLRRSRSRDERLRSRSLERRRSLRGSLPRSLSLSLSERERSLTWDDDDSTASKSRDLLLKTNDNYLVWEYRFGCVFLDKPRSFPIAILSFTATRIAVVLTWWFGLWLILYAQIGVHRQKTNNELELDVVT